MRTWLHRTAWSLLLIALAVAAVRLAVIAGPMETGWETIATTFRGEALGWTVWKHTPISNQEPPEQAEYWLREVDRILWLLPVMLRVTENQFQYRMQYCRNPADRVARIYGARSKVLASEDDMAAIRAEVELHFARVREERVVSDGDR